MNDVKPSTVPATEPGTGSSGWRSATRLYLRQGGRIGPLLVAAVSVIFAVEASGLDPGTLSQPGPAMWPYVVSGLTFVLSVAAAVARPDIPRLVRRSGLFRVAVYVVSFLAFIILYPMIGFIPSSMLLCLSLLRLAAKERWVTTILISTIVPVVVYLIFGLFLELPITPWPYL